jgi:SAM-dependent methyltransferase
VCRKLAWVGVKVQANLLLAVHDPPTEVAIDRVDHFHFGQEVDGRWHAAYHDGRFIAHIIFHTGTLCSGRMEMADHWERQALNWAAWTRGPVPDAYQDYAPAFFTLLPPPSGRVLELGCGEGRVCRDLTARGYSITGVDVAPTMVRLARESDPAGDYRVSDAAALPFGDAEFELVFAYNSLMDVDDLEGAVREAARVLEPGGRFAICVTHPLADAGMFAAVEADAPFVIKGSYLARRHFDGPPTQRNGVTMEFRGWAYPLEAYVKALSQAGMLIEALQEPAVPEAAVTRDPAEARWQRIPAFLFLRAIKALGCAEPMCES